MRLTSIRLRGLLAFRDEVALDLAAIPGRLVAVVGENGSGKSTLLESPVAALYRQLLSRDGSLYEHVNGEAFVEARFHDDAGATIEARLQVDGPRRKTEQHLLLDGRPLTTGREAEVRAEVEKRFGSLELLTASVFAAQNRRGDLVGLSRVERKALFVELLGLGRYVAMAEAAKARREATAVRFEVAQQGAAQLARVQEALAGLEVEADLSAGAAQEALEQAGRLSAQATIAGEALREAMAGYERARALRRASEDAARARDAAAAALEGAAARVKAAQQRLATCSERSKAAMAALDDRAQRASAALDAEREAGAAAQKAARSLEAQATALEAKGRDLAAAAKARGDAEAVLARARQAVERRSAAIEQARQHLSESAGLLGRVPCAGTIWTPAQERGGGLSGEVRVNLEGTCPLLAAARDARDKLPTLAVEPALLDAVADAEAAVDMCHEVAAADVEATRKDWSAANARLTAQREIAARAERGARDAGEELERVKAGRATQREDDSREREEAVREQKLADKARAHAMQDAATAKQRAAQAEAEAAGVTVPDVEPLRAAVVAREAEAHAARKGADEARAVNERLRGRIEELTRSAAAASEQAAEAARLGLDLGDWRVLEQALGKDGLQALEVDAAGPAVAAIVNDLLATCWGSRFTLRFETLREKKAEAGFTEVFEIRVFDAEREAERVVEQLSGGEKVIVSEALALGLAVYNARRNGVAWRTLFRDETCGALSSANALAYLAMLRRAADVGGFEQVLFVAHQPELWERADARVVVGGGRVTVS